MNRRQGGGGGGEGGLRQRGGIGKDKIGQD